MTERTADRIREELEQSIIGGAFADGERLDEVSLSEQFNVSRTPVREALHALSASGLVEQLPRRGAFVRYPSFRRTIEMFEVMAELEGMCGRLAARRMTDSGIVAIEKAMQGCEAAHLAGDTDQYYRENETFHHLIYAASGNTFLSGEASKLHRRLRPFRRLQLRVRNRMRQSLNEHRDIVEAIRSGDADLTGRLMHDHVAIQGEKFNDLMASYDEARAG
ncbi:GntR family transcriptional regulator [Hoeflea sp. WL0058]|uniref:GntR family transcriptional regulator n=1 Tax=Flavimaribacter sediminis TaxID=2865987 RepID=A0AAE2ZJX0_9HYPH|nr:GntR family transcriptional regulator [Flavimaribacter sediminis]MBW8635935.1 GntR family transcriptional regulator [Flavimaribacter sediminis]